MRLREQWEIAYAVSLDDKPIEAASATGKNGKTQMEIVGSNKKDAYSSQFADQWELFFPGQPIPARRRIKLQEIDRAFCGYG